MSRGVIIAVGLLALVVVTARVAATFLEVLVLPSRIIQVAVIGVVAAGAIGAAAYAMARTRRGS